MREVLKTEALKEEAKKETEAKKDEPVSAFDFKAMFKAQQERKNGEHGKCGQGEQRNKQRIAHKFGSGAGQPVPERFKKRRNDQF